MTDPIETLTEKNRQELTALEKQLGHSFTNQALLQMALIHSSFAFEHPGLQGKDNERLEFLGDAVLDLTVGAALFGRFPHMKEGEMTRIRAALVKEGHLALMSQALGLGSAILLGKGENASNGRGKPSILSCTFEAVAGAIFLDGGYDAAHAFSKTHFFPWIEKRDELLKKADAKSRLQEILQEKYTEAPKYVLEKAQGPDHNKLFTVAVTFRDKTLGTGNAGSKKEAEQQAAASALEEIDQCLPL